MRPRRPPPPDLDSDDGVLDALDQVEALVDVAEAALDAHHRYRSLGTDGG